MKVTKKELSRLIRNVLVEQAIPSGTKASGSDGGKQNTRRRRRRTNKKSKSSSLPRISTSSLASIKQSATRDKERIVRRLASKKYKIDSDKLKRGVSATEKDLKASIQQFANAIEKVSMIPNSAAGKIKEYGQMLEDIARYFEKRISLENKLKATKNTDYVEIAKSLESMPGDLIKARNDLDATGRAFNAALKKIGPAVNDFSDGMRGLSAGLEATGKTVNRAVDFLESVEVFFGYKKPAKIRPENWNHSFEEFLIAVNKRIFKPLMKSIKSKDLRAANKTITPFKENKHVLHSIDYLYRLNKRKSQRDNFWSSISNFIDTSKIMHSYSFNEFVDSDNISDLINATIASQLRKSQGSINYYTKKAMSSAGMDTDEVELKRKALKGLDALYNLNN